MYKCLFCDGEYTPIEPPVKDLVCYIPNCDKTGTNMFPTKGLVVKPHACLNCGNIQMFAIKENKIVTQ